MDLDCVAKQFGFRPKYYFNDVSFDKANVSNLFYQLENLNFKNFAKYEKLKHLVQKDKKDDDIVLLLKAYVSYIDGDFNSSVNYFFQMIERCPTNIDTWQHLAFALMKKKYYGLALDILFNLYHFIHFYQKYNFHILNIENLAILANIIRDSEPKNNYLFQPKFEEEFLIVSRNCNNNCMTCPNKHSLKIFDIMPYLKSIGMGLGEYISLKIRKKHIKTLIFTGGEPTMLGTFFGIVDAIYHARPDINLVVQTNGRAFSSEIFTARFERYRTRRISFEVSLFSDKEKTHDRITRCKGSFGQTIKGIENLLEGSYPVDINIVLYQLNLKDIDRVVDFAASLFAKHKTFNKINFIIPVPSGNCAEIFDMKEAKKRLSCVEKYIKKYKGKIPLEIKNQYF